MQPPAPSSTSPRSDAAPPSGTEMWTGTYKAAPGTLFVPPDWKVRVAQNDSGAGLGEGSLSLILDAGTHRMHGTVTGPLGPATVDGYVSDGKFSGSIIRTDAADRGFAGTLLGGATGHHLEGTMNVSLGEASVIRRATFVLSRTAPE